MMSDATLVDWIVNLYSSDLSAFDYTETTIAHETPARITWGLAHVDRGQAIVCRGSVTIEDWILDLESEASRVVIGYPSLGHVPYGFGAGLLEAYTAIKAHLSPWLSSTDPLYIMGHSLGAAHAVLLAGMFTADQVWPVTKLLLLGCPKPCQLPLATLLGRTTIHSYRNGKDPVPDVPVAIPPLLPWQHVAPMTELNVQPTEVWHGLSPDLAMAWHNVNLYQAGIKALGA